MRISTNQIFNTGLSAMQRAQVDLNQTQLQLSTGRRILAPADDPNGAAQAVRFQSAISVTEQYQSNVDTAQARLELEESQLDAVETYMHQARQLVLSAGNDAYNATDRQTTANELRQIKENLLGIANSKDANGEYLFAGTKSSSQPFETDADGVVVYVGADGVGAVREAPISSTRSIQVGDTGKSVFMDVQDASGQLIESVPALSNTGSLVVDRSEIADETAFTLNAEDSFRIEFYNDASGSSVYRVVDVATGTTIEDDASNPIEDMSYTPGTPIEFAGRSITLSGTPDAGDSVTSRPTRDLSVFDVLDTIATALENAGSSTSETMADATEAALLNIDSSLDRVSDVRTSVGTRLQVLDTQTGMHDERLVDLRSTLSEVRDLDYAEAISRYQRQEVVLQAAQQTYVQTSRLSLFDFL